MSDFSDRPFTTGTVVGLRTFRLRLDGVLVGVRGNAWTGGENAAECLRGDGDTLNARLSGLALAEPGHRAAIKDCTCGFYAYFDGSNDYGVGQWSNRVPAIIEGYGVVTIGTRGFRAEKAKILALTDLNPEWGADPDLAEHYPDIPVYRSEEEMLAAHPISDPRDFGITPSPPSTFRQFAAGGYIVGPGVGWTATCGIAQELTEEPADPVARMRQRAEEAARRRQANLRNFNGINRRQRSL